MLVASIHSIPKHGCPEYVQNTFDSALDASLAVSGVLKGYDQLLNLVLDETVEYLRGKCYG